MSILYLIVLQILIFSSLAHLKQLFRSKLLIT
jgi:hypothetical protein